jgi:exosortase/archaeosortase family protein
MKVLLLLAAQAAALWPAAHWSWLRARYASPERTMLVAFAALALLVFVASRRRTGQPERDLTGPALGVLAAGLAGAWLPGLPAALCAAASLTWTAAVLASERRFHVGWFGLAFLALPVLPVFQTHLGLPLRLASATGAAALLRMAGLDVVAAGAYLDEAGALVGVDPPCAGLGMLWTALLAAFVAASLWDVGNLATAASALGVTLAVVAANVLRTAALFLLETRSLAAPTWAHPAVGLLLELVVVLAILWFMRSRAPDPCAAT